MVSNFRIKIGLSDSQKIIYCLPSGRIIHALKTEESNFHYKPQILVLSNLVFLLVYDSEHTVRLKKKKIVLLKFLTLGFSIAINEVARPKPTVL